MTIKLKNRIGAALLALTVASAPALAHPPIPERPAEVEKSAFEADRADILAMAGAFKVRFDMQESTAWAADYQPLDRKISGGHELVKVIEDTGRKIVLQHLLVVDALAPLVVEEVEEERPHEDGDGAVLLGPAHLADSLVGQQDRHQARPG